MREFTRLYLDLDATQSTTEKIGRLKSYFRDEDTPDRDKAWALALLTGNRPKRAASTGALKTLAREVTGTPKWLFDACYESVGDLSETIALLLPDGEEGHAPRRDHATEPLHATIERRVLPLIGADDDEKRSIIRAAWARMDADDRFVYHKLIRGGFRVGVQKKLVSRALAGVAGVDDKVMAQRLVATTEPTPEAYRAVLSGEVSAERALAPLPFYLATPLDEEPSSLGGTLGDPAAWQAEWKYDGIRAQLVRRGGGIAIWSRGEELVTHQFPELVAAARGLPRDAVLDGEILIWTGGEDGGTPAPFSDLQTRLNRKAAPSPQLGLFESSRLVMLAFDLLELDGADLRDRPQHERRALLEDCLSDHAAHDATDTIRLSPLVESESWEALASLRAQSRERGVEGLMLKHRAAPYLVGRTRSDTGWFKWKIDPFTVDCVMVSAQPGSGRRASLYTDYTFAVRAGDDPDAELVTFAKAYSGLTQDEIESLDRWIRANTTQKNGPFRAVKPEQVFELAFEGVQPSPRHKAGLAVRFPRISRWRTDKPAHEIDTLGTLRAMIRTTDDGGRP